MDFPRHIPFVEALGMQLLSFADGEAEIAIDLQPEQMNGLGIAHGGVTMTLLDVAMAHAAKSPRASRAPDPSGGVVTIEMKTSFMRAGHARLVAKGRLLHETRTMAFCESTVYGADGGIVAHATGTFKFVAGPKADGMRPAKASASD